MLPLMALSFWGFSHLRLFEIYYFFPGALFGLFYSVYLVRRYGGTPGKLMVGIRIRKVDGEPVGYREAFLRYLPDFVLGILMSVASILTVIHMSDAEYHSLGLMALSKRMGELAPSWEKPLQWVQNIWIWGELIVLLTNRKRRAIHDFIAGTVVVYALPKTTVEPATADPVVST
jgi:uncharacterized RDD family membrane protein YckC